MTTRTRRLKALTAAATAIAATFAFTACTAATVPSPQASISPDAPVSLTFWTGQSDEAEKILEGLASEFEKLHPNVTIEVSLWGLIHRRATAEAVGRLRQQHLSEHLLLLRIVGQRAGVVRKDPGHHGAGGRSGDQVGRVLRGGAGHRPPNRRQDDRLPGIGGQPVADLQQDRVRRCERGLPHGELDLGRFPDRSKQLTNPDKQTYGYAYSVSGSEETTWQFWPHLWQNGGKILTDDNAKSAFASPEGERSLEFLRGMAIDDKSVYLDQTDTKFAQLFAANRIGMMTSGPWQLYDLNTAKTKYGVTVLPGTNGDHQTVSGPDIWALMDTGDANENHWSFEFLKWLTDPAQDVRWNVAYGNLPLRTSELDSPEFKAQVKALPGLDVMAANNANAKQARPTVPATSGLSEAIGAAISHVLQGDGTPAEALAGAAKKADDALADR